MNKIIFLERLQQERDAFELLLNKVGFSRQMTMKGVYGSLSIKDLLADILARELFIADRLSEILHSESHDKCETFAELQDFQSEYGFPDYESDLTNKTEPNHLVIYKYKNIGLDDIVEQEIAVYAAILISMEKLTHEQFLDHDLYYRVGEQTYKSYRRVAGYIRSWLKSIEAESK